MCSGKMSKVIQSEIYGRTSSGHVKISAESMGCFEGQILERKFIQVQCHWGHRMEDLGSHD